MVSWDMKVKFLGLSPNIKELVKLAKEHKFSNIESMEFIKADKNCSATYYMCVNNRGTQQTEFKCEVF